MTFHLIMLRPDKEFFSGEVESLMISKPDGRETILARHMPVFMNLTTDICSFTLADGTKKAFAMGEGMLTVSGREVVLQSDFLAWEEKMEEAVAHRETYIDAETQRRKKSFLEYKQNKIEMAKTFMKLQRRHTDSEDSK
ncbi:MAG: F0F1 ATP synthase subunit epsilon [Clostridia bacterium]|nr:F0F1 ATP synthase subunit epsilon [Clostridia bacterium]